MKTIKREAILCGVANMIVGCLCNVEGEATKLLTDAAGKEPDALARLCLDICAENNRIASATGCPACQDTGVAVFFVEVGRSAQLEFDLTDCLNEAVTLAYKDFRKSIAHPLTRQNTQTNAPAVIHYDFVAGDGVKISYLAKGAGAENMSKLYMLTPSDGHSGIVASVLDAVKCAGGNPCPPLVVGVGIGGTMEKAAVLSKLALTRSTGTPSPDKSARELEQLLLDKINALGIGAQGLGGDTTALAVAVELYPTHIGMLPVAVNLQCHCVRHGTVAF